MEVTLTIAVATFAICLLAIVQIYALVSGRMLRNPRWLLIMGVVVAAIAVMIKALPMLAHSVWKGPGVEGLDVAAAVIDPTLMALAGGLIGSAFVLKIQLLHDQERDFLLASRIELTELMTGQLNIASVNPANGEANDLQRDVLISRLNRQREIEKALRELSGNDFVDSLSAVSRERNRTEWID
jgi:signal transduction histidine kinase